MSEDHLEISPMSTLLAGIAGGGDSRFVDVPHEPTKDDQRTSVNVSTTFDKASFEIDDLPGERIGKKIKIPDDVEVNATQRRFEMTKAGRTKPVTVGSSMDGLKASVEDGHVIIEIDTDGKYPAAGQMNLALNVNDVLAGFSYLQRQPSELDSGSGTAKTASPKADRDEVESWH